MRTGDRLACLLVSTSSSAALAFIASTFSAVERVDDAIARDHVRPTGHTGVVDDGHGTAVPDDFAGDRRKLLVLPDG